MVTGCNGQLGSEIRVLSPGYKNINFLFSDIQELDITDFNKLKSYISEHKIDCIVNCAAYTAVDKAESEPELAAEINVKAVSNLAKLSVQFNIPLIHISTDYVFDGINYKPYLETDKTNPCSVYGKTKLSGEEEIIKEFGVGSSEIGVQNHKAIIIRTSWLYSSFGNNFVKSMIKYAKERGSLNVVSDQVGTPTYARDLAKAILDIVFKTDKIHSPQSTVEIYNYSNEGVCSWYDFAKSIIEISDIKCPVNPIETKDYPTPAKRPQYSVLSKVKIREHFNIFIPHWRDSLKECLNILNG